MENELFIPGSESSYGKWKGPICSSWFWFWKCPHPFSTAPMSTEDLYPKGCIGTAMILLVTQDDTPVSFHGKAAGDSDDGGATGKQGRWVVEVGKGAFTQEVVPPGQRDLWETLDSVTKTVRSRGSELCEMRLQRSQNLVKKKVPMRGRRQKGPEYCISLQVGPMAHQFCDSNSLTVTLSISESKTNISQIFNDLDGCSQQPKHSLVSWLATHVWLLPIKLLQLLRTSHFTHWLSP